MSALTPPIADAVDHSLPLALSPAEAAAELGISRAKLYQLLDNGTIPSLKLGRRRLIRRAALVALLADLEQTGLGPEEAA